MDISIWFFNEPIVQNNAIVHVCQDLEWQIIMEKKQIVLRAPGQKSVNSRMFSIFRKFLVYSLNGKSHR